MAFIRYPKIRELPFLFSKAEASFRKIYSERSKQGTLVAWLKFHGSYAFAKGMAQEELPQPPAGDCSEKHGCYCPELGHAMCRAMKRAAEGKWRYRRFLYDVSSAKNGMPPASESFIEGSLASHQKALTRKEPVRDPADQLRYISNIAAVKSEIARIVRKLFHGKVFAHCDPFPSTSSSYASSLKEGGAFAEIVKDFKIPISTFVNTTTGQIEDEKLVRAFQDYVDLMWTSRATKPLDVTPVPILEPLKVRMITKGLAAEYYRCVELQKFMHSVLRQHPVFSYIGHPIDDKTFSECFGSLGDLPTGWFYVSGDYKAATDNLNPELSDYCWEQICLNTNIDWRGRSCRLYDTAYYHLGKKALIGHRIHYKDSTVDQTWGQLMGSPMSFPILCLVNCAATVVALHERFSKTLRMRINGDDIGFIADASRYQVWKTITADCGLEFSLGKNFCSREFLVMNSELRRPPRNPQAFYVPGEVVGDPNDIENPERVPIRWCFSGLWKLEAFFNQSIARNLVRKGVDAGKTKDVYWTDLGPLAVALLRGVDKKHEKAFLDVFLAHNRAVLQERPVGCNLFVPKNLGGCGIPIPAGSTFVGIQSTTTKPQTLAQAQLKAAYLATHGERRLKTAQLEPLDQGRVALAIKKAKSIGPARVPRPIIERKVDCGLTSTQLLSRVIQEYQKQPHYGLDTQPEIRIQKDDPSWKNSCLTSPAVHQARVQRLNGKYYAYTRMGDNVKYSLSPMSIEKIFQFEETEMLDTLWPVTGSTCPERLLDEFDSMYACESLTALFWEAT